MCRKYRNRGILELILLSNFFNKEYLLRNKKSIKFKMYAEFQILNWKNRNYRLI